MRPVVDVWPNAATTEKTAASQSDHTPNDLLLILGPPALDNPLPTPNCQSSAAVGAAEELCPFGSRILVAPPMPVNRQRHHPTKLFICLYLNRERTAPLSRGMLGYSIVWN